MIVPVDTAPDTVFKLNKLGFFFHVYILFMVFLMIFKSLVGLACVVFVSVAPVILENYFMNY